jgi:hypothetical protein
MWGFYHTQPRWATHVAAAFDFHSQPVYNRAHAQANPGRR